MATAPMETIGQQLAEYVFINLVKKSKYKFVHVNEVTEFLKSKLEDEYTSELGYAVKDALESHSKIDFFREGEYIHNQKFHYSAGRFYAVKGTYKNPIEAKDKMGWYSWQETAEIDWDNLD